MLSPYFLPEVTSEQFGQQGCEVLEESPPGSLNSKWRENHRHTPSPTREDPAGLPGIWLCGEVPSVVPFTGKMWRGLWGDLPCHDSPLALFPRYEEEIALRATAENEFVALKKVSNMGLGS